MAGNKGAADSKGVAGNKESPFCVLPAACLCLRAVITNSGLGYRCEDCDTDVRTGMSIVFLKAKKLFLGLTAGVVPEWGTRAGVRYLGSGCTKNNTAGIGTAAPSCTHFQHCLPERQLWSLLGVTSFH